MHLGELSLWLALFFAMWSTLVSFADNAPDGFAWASSGSRALGVATFFSALALVSVARAFVAHDFTYAIVAATSGLNLSTAYGVAALWAGTPGAVLLLSVWMGVAGSVLVASSHRTAVRSMRATGVMAALMTLSLLELCLALKPFARLDWSAGEGLGLKPELQGAGMLVHPPMLLLAYAMTALPFAVALDTLLAERLDAARWRTLQRTNVAAWCALTIAIALGMHWSYQHPERDGVWLWDGVFNLAVLPWVATGALVIASRWPALRRRLGASIVVLGAFPLPLSLLALLAARGGMMHRVFATAGTPAETWLLGLLTVVTAAAAYVLTTQLPVLAIEPAHADERAPEFADADVPATPTRIVTRDRAIRLGTIAACGWGSVGALLAEAAGGAPSGQTGAVVDSMHGAVGVAMLALTLVAIAVAVRVAHVVSRRAVLSAAGGAIVVLAGALGLGVRDFFALVALVLSGAVMGLLLDEMAAGVAARANVHGDAVPAAVMRHVSQHRRRHAGHIITLAAAMLAAVGIGRLSRREVNASLESGQTLTQVDPLGHRWTFLSEGLSRFEEANRSVMAITVAVAHDGQSAGLVTSEKRQYTDDAGNALADATTEPGIVHFGREDVYIVFDSTTDAGETHVTIRFNPLVQWLWAAIALLVVGVALYAWPRGARASLRRARDFAPADRPSTAAGRA